MIRFFCDEMLKDLARWLRAAGYDTSAAPDGTPDAAILQEARRERRVLLSRDRALLRCGVEGGAAYLVTARTLDAAARELRASLGVDWLLAPFTRCLVDNSPLRSGTPEEEMRVPPRARALPGGVMTCPSCGRLYWEGGHVRRMRARLTAWQTIVPTPDEETTSTGRFSAF